MMKKLFLFTLLVLSFLVISCKNNTTDSTSGGGSTPPPAESEYKANGISSIYEGRGYKFYSMDGETYAITIKDGGITGLQQNTVKVDLTKSDIYSINIEGDITTSVTTDNYRLYLIYNSECKGSIILPKDTATIYGSVNIIKNDGTKIEGLIYNLPEGLKIPADYKYTWEGTTTGGKTETVTIDDKFVTLSSSYDPSNKDYIPSSFFMYIEKSKECQVLGDYYNGTRMYLNEDGTLTFIFNRTAIKAEPIVENGKVVIYKNTSSTHSDITFAKLTKKQ